MRDGTNADTTHGATDPTLLITKVSPAGQLNNAREAYLQFDVASVSGTISSVTLKVYGKVDGTSVLSVGGETSLIAYDMQGRQVSVLVKGFLPAGTHRSTFTPPAASTGIYLLKLAHNGKMEVLYRKILTV